MCYKELFGLVCDEMRQAEWKSCNVIQSYINCNSEWIWRSEISLSADQGMAGRTMILMTESQRFIITATFHPGPSSAGI
jgi:hypothetical protein